MKISQILVGFLGLYFVLLLRSWMFKIMKVEARRESDRLIAEARARSIALGTNPDEQEGE